MTPGLLIFAFTLLVFELSINAYWATDHATSFIQLDYALWNNHTVVLGSVSSTPPWTVDNFRYNGQNYSALAPGTAFLALPFSGAAFSLAGGYTAYGPALTLPETMVAIAGAISAYLLYKIANFYFKRSTSMLLGFAFAFSTISWPFATYFFQSDVSAMFVLLAALFALRSVRSEGTGTSAALVSGLAIGAAFTVDYVNAVLIPVFLGFIFVKKWKAKREMPLVLGAFFLGCVPGFSAIGAYNYAIFGSPLMTTEQAYLGSSLLGEFTTPIYYGLALDLVSLSRGLFAFAPFTVLGVLGLTDGLRYKGARTDMVLFLAIFLGILLPYSAWYDPTGGLSFGPRFLVAGIPFMILPGGYVIEQAVGAKRWLPYATYAAGAVINGMAALIIAVPPATDFNVSPLVNYIVPHFLIGDYGTWWAPFGSHSWVAGAALVISLGVITPLAWVESVRRRESSHGTQS